MAIVEGLPDFPAIDQINKALWKVGKTRGAAVLVGAGFSQNAERMHEGTPLPPDWNALAKLLQVRLGYPAHEYKDALRMAEEFGAFLGRGALDNLISEAVPDEEWLPGRLHTKLVGLNWVDILTTNWDTLLERAANQNLGQSYDVVRCLEDVASKRAPRIVKLHGSLPSNRPFIVSEEDYRTYPRKFAPFVNLVQQVFLENELCLIGFSGDDPNFLEWSGWIRDHLGNSARRIYLIGVLNLRPAQRKLLEQRHISPVDLAPLVQDVEPARQHGVALELLLEYFSEHKPAASWEWKFGDAGEFPLQHPAPSLEYLSVRFADVPEQWRRARKAYPAWAVCPPDLRYELTRHTYRWLQRADVIRAAPSLLRGRFAYEAAWRIETALSPISGHESLFVEIVEDNSCWDVPRKKDYVVCTLLRAAREDRDAASFSRWCSVLELRQGSNEEALAWLAYERACWARDGFDFTDLTIHASFIQGRDPIWKLRKAALYAELGETSIAESLAKEGMADARAQHLKDRNSIWALSRLGWTRNLARQYRSLEEAFSPEPDGVDYSSLERRLLEAKCEPWDWIEELDRGINKALGRLEEQKSRIEPRFDVGTYKDHGTHYFGGWDEKPLFECFRLATTIGLPARTEHSKFLSDRLDKADPLGSASSDADLLRILWTIQSGGEATLERRFSRLAVANMSIDRVGFLLTTLEKALAFGSGKMHERKGWADQFWSGRCARYVELLSRLVVRLEPARAQSLLGQTLTYADDPAWQWRETHDSLRHLVERSLSAIPPQDRRVHLVQLISFPLPNETSLPEYDQDVWPDASEWLTGSVLMQPPERDRFDSRIIELIEGVRSARPSARSQGANRLIRLHLAGLLTSQQAQLFSDTLWSRRSQSTGLPADTHLLPHVFLELPAPPDAHPLEAIKTESCTTDFTTFVISIANAGMKGTAGVQSPRMLLTKEEVPAFMEKLLGWTPPRVPVLDLNRVAESNQNAYQAIGAAIANQILPLLEAGELESIAVEQLVDRATAQKALVRAFPELIRLSPETAERGTQAILDAMISDQTNDCWSGFNAIYRWLRGWQAARFVQVPRKLIDGLLWTIDTRSDAGRLHALMNAFHLVEAGLFDNVDHSRLSHALGYLLGSTSYESAPNTTSLTLIRAACVRLASALARAGERSDSVDSWIELADRDPLPEVRFALVTPVE